MLTVCTYGGLAELDPSFLPVITDFSPKWGPVGTWVSFNGSNLLDVVSIEFNGVDAVFQYPMPFAPPVAIVPTNATTGPITITTSNGSATTSEAFSVTVRGPPVIDRFFPTSGQPGTLVRLHGTNLDTITSVTFNGEPAVFTDPCPAGFPCPITVVPTNATTGPITVSSAEGSFTTSEVFTVIPIGQPFVTSFKPASGIPGTLVSLFGTNLVEVKSVLFNGAPARFAGGVRDGFLEAGVPLGATTGPITVITDKGSGTSADLFTVLPLPLPVITGFTPDRASPGSWITVTGSNFLFVASVEINGVGVEFNYAEYWVSARVPFAASGPITVLSAGGVAVSSNALTVLGGPAPPEILSFFPTNGPSGTRVRIAGMKLGTVTAILFNGVGAEFDVNRGDILAVVPPGTKPGLISVKTTLGQAVSKEPFAAFNTGDLAVVTKAAVDPLLWPNAISISILVTNPTTAVIEHVTLTNAFARGTPPSGDLVIWNEGYPDFNGLPLADLELISVSGSTGTFTTPDSGLACDLAPLDPAGSTTITLEVRPRTPGMFHVLATAVGTRAAVGRVFGSAVTTVAIMAPNQLLIHRIDRERVEIAWQILDPPVVLQAADNLLRAPFWSDVTVPATATNGRASLLLPTVTGSQFYRLRPE